MADLDDLNDYYYGFSVSLALQNWLFLLYVWYLDTSKNLYVEIMHK